MWMGPNQGGADGLTCVAAKTLLANCNVLMLIYPMCTKQAQGLRLSDSQRLVSQSQGPVT